MVRVSCLKFCLRTPNIFHWYGSLIGSYGCFVDYGTCAACTIHRALLAAIAWLAGFCFGFTKASVMVVDDGFYVWGATIADFNCISVEYFVEFMVGWEMCVYQS